MKKYIKPEATSIQIAATSPIAVSTLGVFSLDADDSTIYARRHRGIIDDDDYWEEDSDEEDEW